MNRICNAKQEDSQEILELYKSFYNGPADWDDNYPNEDSIIFDLSRDALFVMKNDDGEVVAAISIDEDEEIAELSYWNKNLFPSGEFAMLCVRRDMQGKGIAKSMVMHVLEILRKEGKKSVHILVRAGHRTAIALYSSVGFKTVGECNIFEKDFICMEIEL